MQGISSVGIIDICYYAYTVIFVFMLWISILLDTNNLSCFLTRASYSDGKLQAPPKPCAGNQGTQITVRVEHGNKTGDKQLSGNAE